MNKRKKKGPKRPTKPISSRHDEFTVKFRHLIDEDDLAQAGVFLNGGADPVLTIGVLGPLDAARKDRIAMAILEVLGMCLGEASCQVIEQNAHLFATGLH